MTRGKDLAAQLLCGTGIDALVRRQLREQLAIFMFHGIEQELLSPSCWHVIDTAMLRRQLEFLRRHFVILPLEQALEQLREGSLPDRAATLTFDDGTRNLATHAGPVLNEFDAPAAVFVTTGPMGTRETLWADRLWLGFARSTHTVIDLTSIGLGKRSLRHDAERGEVYQSVVHRLKELADDERIAQCASVVRDLGLQDDEDPGPFQLLSWDDARQLAKDSAVTLYPHSVTHPILSRCSDTKVQYEIAESCAALKRETGFVPNVFAYPNGRLQDFDDRARAALREQGIGWALSTVEGFADRNSDPLALPRIGIGSDLSYAGFKLFASSGLSSPKAQLADLVRRSAGPSGY